METIVQEPFYAFLFIGLGLIFLLLELFVPSAGVLGLLAVGSAAFGIFCFFYQGNPLLGFGAIVGTGVLGALTIRFGLRRLSFSGTLPPSTSTSVDDRIENLAGKVGVTYTPLRPAGVAIIDGKRVDVVTPGEFIGQNVPVRVIDTTGNRVVVRENSRAGE
jgi:membrane-bound serine protease (ClpP class)